jgi:regulator of sirC expression with transglutaminase-like and TPR domain
VENEIVAAFRSAIRGSDIDVDLFGAAMAIAGLRGAPADSHGVARELDLIAEDVRTQAGDTLDPGELAHAIDHELFAVRGFRGNAEAYDDPANSYLDQVVARRLGIPITLSLVYMEIAQRVGLRCDGIGYPGHFIVRCGEPEAPIYVDPFHQGARLDRVELIAGLRAYNLGGASYSSFLAGITRRQILQRMLNNLHTVFRASRDLSRWLLTIELLLCIEPWNAALVGERGMLHYRLGRPDSALEDLERYAAAGESESLTAGARRLLHELRLQYGRQEGTP